MILARFIYENAVVSYSLLKDRQEVATVADDLFSEEDGVVELSILHFDDESDDNLENLWTLLANGS